jgi:5'(3')-deoxyribonucleotidase
MINTKVHIDMDGVIADFFSALAEFRKVNHWKDQGEITLDTSIKELRGTNFFETLPVFPFAKKLVDLVKSYTGGEYYINTSPLRDDMENSRKYKTKWLQKHNFVPNDIIVTKRKESYAVDKQTGLPNILIDDRPKNLEKWIAKGGFGIRYQANEDSIKIVEKGLKLYARTVAELKGKNTESKVTQVDKKSMPKENELG